MQLNAFLAQYAGKPVEALFNPTSPRERPSVDTSGAWTFPVWNDPSTVPPTSEAVNAALAAPPSAEELLAYAKGKRDLAEASGITVNGVAIQSDTDSQNRVNNAYNGMLVSGATEIPFKSGSGFVTLTLEQVKAIGAALFAHTQACFSAEDQVDAAVGASPPTIITFAQIDAVFAGVKSAF